LLAAKTWRLLGMRMCSVAKASKNNRASLSLCYLRVWGLAMNGLAYHGRHLGYDDGHGSSKIRTAKISLPMIIVASAISVLSTPAMAQLTYTELQYNGSGFTGVTGIRGDNMTGNYATGSNNATGGLLYRFSTGAFQPFPVATASGVNFPGATTSTP